MVNPNSFALVLIIHQPFQIQHTPTFKGYCLLDAFDIVEQRTGETDLVVKCFTTEKFDY